MDHILYTPGEASRRWHWWKQFTVVAVPCVLILALMTALLAHTSVRSHIVHFTEQLERNAEVAMERIGSILAHADGSISHTKTTYEKYGNWALGKNLDSGLDMNQIVSRDYLGTLIWSPESSVVDTTRFGMRFYHLGHIINSHRNDASEDAVLSCNTNLQYFLSRRVNDKNGKFAGIVATELSGHRLKTATSNLSLDSNSRFTVSHGGHVHTLAESQPLTQADSSGRVAWLLRTVFAEEPVIKLEKELPYGFVVHAEGNLAEYIGQQMAKAWGLFALFGASIVFLLALSIRIANSGTLVRHREEVANFAARHDQLTGLLNRRGLNDVFSSLESGDAAPSCSLLCIDVDYFKSVNDTLGHVAGDELLKTIARRIVEPLEEGELAFRLGGDEFAVLLYGAAPESARAKRALALADTLCNSIRMSVIINSQSVRVSASIGIASAPRHGHKLQSLHKAADSALYHVKETGRDGYREFDDDFQLQTERKLRLSRALRDAIGLRELSIRFQPVLDLQSKSITQLEAHLAWKSGQWRDVSEAECLRTAEEFGFGLELGKHLFELSCKQAAKWPAGIRLAVNLAPAQLMDYSTAAYLLRVVKYYRIEPSRISFEVAETTLLSAYPRVNDRISALRKLGFGVTLDDFGTGLSSMSCLIDYEFDQIKLSHELVNGVEDDSDRASVIRNSVAMARDLDVKVIADGVRNVEQAEMLAAFGCDCLQGLYVGELRAYGEVDLDELQWKAAYEISHVA